MAVKYVIVRESLVQSIASDVVTFALGLCFMGVGVYLESSAMQWVGAFMFFLTLIGGVVTNKNIHRCKSFTAARAKLDELEAISALAQKQREEFE